jgi:hypothetical protein
MRRKLLAVSEGTIRLGRMMKPNMPAARYGMLPRKRPKVHIVGSHYSPDHLDFETCDDQQTEAAIAGEIRALPTLSSNEHMLVTVRAPVASCTSPPDPVCDRR